MKRLLAAAATALVMTACARNDGLSDGNSFAITRARVFDGTATIDDATVVVEAGRVKAVGADVVAPQGVPVVTAAGKTVIPGLIDSHVHAFDDQSLRDALRFGVTTALDMFTVVDFAQSRKGRRDALAKADQADLYSAGTLVTSPGGHGTEYGLVIPTITAPEQAEEFVRARLAEGSDYIKVVYEPQSQHFTSITKETLTAVIAAAHAERVMAVVHIATRSAARDALEAGADGLVHIFGDAPIDGSLVAEIKNRGAFVIPTLTVVRSVDGEKPGEQLIKDAALAPYLTESQRMNLSQGFNTGPELHALYDADTARANVGKLHAAGVPILAGTDAPNPGTSHGTSIHDEIAQLVAAGLSPTEALAAATSAPAKAFKLEGRGVIASGARADLLLIDGDPTADVTAARSIVRIFKNGYEAARPRQENARKAAIEKPALADGYVSRFDSDLASSFDVDWSVTTDQFLWGDSTASLSRSMPGTSGSGGALRIDGVVSTTFFFPWSGAALFFSPDLDKAYDLSAYEKITCSMKGDARAYTVMLFTRTSKRRPSTRKVRIEGDGWERQEIALSAFGGAAMDEVYGLAIAAERPEGKFHVEVDDVRLE